MKVIVSKRPDGKYDVRIRRTRRSEGASADAKNLSRADLTAWLAEHVKAIDAPQLPLG